MISYEPFWETLEKKNITKYQLIYHWGISSNTLRRMKKGEAISSTTLNELCLILQSDISHIMKFHATEQELCELEFRKKNIASRSKH